MAGRGDEGSLGDFVHVAADALALPVDPVAWPTRPRPWSGKLDELPVLEPCTWLDWSSDAGLCGVLGGALAAAVAGSVFDGAAPH